MKRGGEGREGETWRRIEVTSCHLNPRLADSTELRAMNYFRANIRLPLVRAPLSSSPWRFPEPLCRACTLLKSPMFGPSLKIPVDESIQHTRQPVPNNALLCMFARACAHKRSSECVHGARYYTHVNAPIIMCTFATRQFTTRTRVRIHVRFKELRGVRRDCYFSKSFCRCVRIAVPMFKNAIEKLVLLFICIYC